MSSRFPVRTQRRRFGTLAWVRTAATAIILLASCVGEHCGACACGLPYCGDQYTTPEDNGKTFNLEVGQSIVGRVPDRSVPVVASSTDPKVLKQVGSPKPEIVGQPLITAGFTAIKAGSARLRFAYTQCGGDSSVPCSFEVHVHVVQFPKTRINLTIQDYGQATVQLRVGDSARFSVYTTSGAYRTVTIDTPQVLQWAVQPIELPHGFEGAFTALSPGTAHVLVDVCSVQEKTCRQDWLLTVSVVR